MLSNYRDTIKKVKENRHHNISNSYGVNEAYRYFIKKRKDIPEKTYRAIIKTVNKEIQNNLIEGNDIYLPCRMGHLELRKFLTTVKLVNNKVVTNRPIDWDATIKLWYQNEKAAKNKVKVRAEVPQVFRIYYKKATANYNNKVFYKFSANRELKLRLKDNIINNKVDAFTF